MSGTNYFRDVWPRVVARRYDGGGHMIALVEMDIEVDEELVRIPRGHKLTREQALRYPGDVQHVLPRGESSGAGVLDQLPTARGWRGMSR